MRQVGGRQDLFGGSGAAGRGRVMDFALDDSQIAIGEAARALLDKWASPERVRAVVDRGGGVDAELWGALVEQGWTALTLPAGDGGLALGWIELAVVLEQAGAHLAPAPIGQQALAIDTLAAARGRGPSTARLDAWIEALVRGERIACVPARGAQAPALYAPSAALVVGPVGGDAGRGDGAELVAVELPEEARPVPEPAMDRTRQLGWLSLDDLWLARGERSALSLGGPDAVDVFRDRGAVAHSAEMLGAAARMLEVTVQYAKDRQQFGRPIGSFQAVKHRCADMLVDVEGMRSAVWWAAWCVGHGHRDASVAASTAKIWCSQASERVMAAALQVHGGIGFTWEHDLHLYLKRAELDQVSFGDAVWHRDRLAQLLRARVAAGDEVL